MTQRFILREYHGPHGPTLEQSIENNQWLAAELNKLAIRAEYMQNPATEVLGCPEGVVYIPSLQIVVGYDRWGFIATDLTTEYPLLDQASGEDTLAWFKGKLESTQTEQGVRS